MKLFTKTILIFVGMFIIGLPAFGRDTTWLNCPSMAAGYRHIIAKDSTKLDSFIVATMAANHIPGVAAGIVKDGTIIWTGGYGWANIEENIMVADTTIFMLASISKTFTGAALMQLWEESLFALDDNINDYLPFNVVNPHFPDSAITFRMLLAHTSSINDNWAVMNSVYTPGDCPIPLGEFTENYLTPGGTYYSAGSNFNNWPPGTRWDYCNQAFTLIGYLVEVIAGVPFDQYCKDSIFAPLGMDRTSWFLAGLDTNNVAMPYDCGGSDFIPLGHFGYADFPAGQLRTSTLDLAQHLIAFMQKGRNGGVRILDSTTVELMTTIQYPGIKSNWGLVWYIESSGGRWYWEHGGGDQGVSTRVAYCPDENSGVIVLTNGESHYGVGQIMHELFEFAADHDGDGLIGGYDNCPDVYNPGQEDQDADRVGNVCDNCLTTFNPDQIDSDGDGIGDSCETIRTWHVQLDGAGDSPTIQAAIDSASNRDTVLVADGIYMGGDNRNIELVGKQILVKSENGPEFTIIDCEGNPAEPHRGLTVKNVSGTSCIIDGFTIRGGYGPNYNGGSSGGAILCSYSSPIIRNCVFANNSAFVGGGLAADHSAPRIINCTFFGNSADYGAGIIAYGQSSVTLDNCIIAFNEQDELVSCFGSSIVTLSCSDVYGNAGGDWVGCIADQVEINGNLSTDPMFCDTTGRDFRIASDSPCVPGNNSSDVLIGALGTGCGCYCPSQGDNNDDGQIGVTDIVFLLNYTFRHGSPPPVDSLCPLINRADFNCDGYFNLIDVVGLINYIYRPPAPGPCDPCAP